MSDYTPASEDLPTVPGSVIWRADDFTFAKAGPDESPASGESWLGIRAGWVTDDEIKRVGFKVLWVPPHG